MPYPILLTENADVFVTFNRQNHRIFGLAWPQVSDGWMHTRAIWWKLSSGDHTICFHVLFCERDKYLDILLCHR